MSKIIDSLRKNPFNIVDKWSYKCPECGSDLYYVDSHLDLVMDGNTVGYCEEHEGHVFWQNAREMGDILHLNKNASSTNFDSNKDYKLINNKWEIIN